jgi:SAM-dependent methyltransferase
MTAPKAPTYGGQADLYRRLRPDYPDAVFERLAAACGDNRGVVAELGAGSGQATARLLTLFDRVIAVEPDKAMAALMPSDPRLEIRSQWAEAAVFDQPLDAMVAATAFHWMDARAVCEMARRSLKPDGVFMPFGYGPFRFVNPPAAQRLGEQEYEFWKPWTDIRLVRWRHYADIVQETGVAKTVEPFDMAFERRFSAEDAAGLMLTTSYAAAVGREQPDYAKNLIRRVAKAAGGEEVTIRFELMGCVARF